MNSYPEGDEAVGVASRGWGNENYADFAALVSSPGLGKMAFLDRICWEAPTI
jgi:hypothetical protein